MKLINRVKSIKGSIKFKKKKSVYRFLLMLSIPGLNQDRQSTIKVQQAMPSFIYEPEMTLEDYIQAKNAQRKIQYKLLNVQYGGSNPLTDEKEFFFEKQVHDIKTFVLDIIGEGSLYNKYVTMIDNLYISFMKQITVYHHLKVEREAQAKDARLQEFKKSNYQISQYLKSVQNEHQDIDSKLEYLKKTKELYKVQREKQLQERLKKEKQKEQRLKKEIEQQLLKNKEKLLLTLNPPNQQKDKPQQTLQQIQVKKKAQAKKTAKQLQQYNKRRQSIGKISNVFASFIHQ